MEKLMVRFTKLFLFLAFFSGLTFPQERILLITYGPKAETREGDYDYTQVIYIKVNKAVTDHLYLRIFDADCSGKIDSPAGEFDTETNFKLFGGIGAFGNPSLDAQRNLVEDRDSGVLIKEETFSVNPFQDNKWYNFQKLNPLDGELRGEHYYFKLVVKGSSGNDGNIFDVAVSSNEKSNSPVDGVEVLSYAPTIRLPEKNIFAEMRFFTPGDAEALEIHNFDAANALINLETKYRSNLKVTPSQQDNWSYSRIQLDPIEKNIINAVSFRDGGEIPNDATFFVTDDKDRILPIIHPVYQHKPNSRPVPDATAKILADCYSVVFDASKSTDADGDALDYNWDFGDGVKGSGIRVAHVYKEIGLYNIRLIVSDRSGVISNSAIKDISVKLNNAPIASAGKDIVAAPGESFFLDGSASSDSDGKIIKYFWEIADGGKLSGITQSYKINKAGKYSVKLRVEDDSDTPCNNAEDELFVIINSQPVVDIGEDRIAAVDQLLEFSGARSFDSDGEIQEYSWDMGDGNLLKGEVIKHVFASPGKYKVKLTIKDNTEVSNNSANDEMTVFVNDRPVAEAGKDFRVAKDEEIIFDGSASVDRDGSIINYSWDFGDGSEGTGKSVKHSYAAPGVYKVYLIVQDNSTSISDKNSDSLTVIINYPPVAQAGPDQVVTTSSVSFDAGESSDQDGAITQYAWDFGDNSSGSGQTTTHYYKNPGIYKVILTVTDDSKTGTQKTSDELFVNVNRKPIADAGMDQIGAPGQELAFSAANSSDPDGEIVFYRWDFGDGETADGIETSHKFQYPGTYTVGLIVGDNTGHKEAIDFDNVKVVINESPVAVAGKDIITAPGLSVNFSGNLSTDPDGSLVDFEWTFTDTGSVFKGNQITRSFSHPGIYTAVLRVKDNGEAINSFAEDRINIYVNDRPAARLAGDIITCDPSVVISGADSGDPDGDPLTYSWDFGDGSPLQQGITVSHNYSEGGTYPVILTVDDGKSLPNSTSTASILVKINKAPLAEAGPDKTICAGDIVLFDGGATIDPEGGLIKFIWDFGDGTTAEGMNPSKTYKKGGIYRVTLFVKDDSGLECNSDADFLIVTVADSPIANAGEDKVVCSNTVVQFDGSKSYDFDGVVNNYSWDFGDGSVGGGAKPTHVYTKPGEYRVLLTITGDLVGECDNTDKDELIVKVLEAPEAKFTFEKIVAKDQVVTFDGTSSTSVSSNIVEYIWDFGDGNTKSGGIVSHSYSAPGKYFIDLTIRTDGKSECSSAPARDYIIVNAAPIAQAGNDIFGGVGNQLIFNAINSYDPDGAIVKYAWDFGDGNLSEGIEVKHTYKSSGDYIVILKVNDNTMLSNSDNSDTLTAKINFSPEPQIILSEWACPGENVKFDGTSSTDKDNEHVSYKWDFGDGTQADSAIAHHMYTVTGTYNVSLTIDDGTNTANAVAVAQKILKVNNSPFVYGGSDRIVCPGNDVVFDASQSHDIDGSVDKYLWDFGDGSVAEGIKVLHSYSRGGRFLVTVTGSDNSGKPCGIAADSLIVIVNTSPVADAGPDRKIFTGGAHDAVLFDAGNSYDTDGDPLSYIWDFGDGNTKTGEKAYHYFAKPGVYKVKLRVSDNTGLPCAFSEDEQLVEVILR